GRNPTYRCTRCRHVFSPDAEAEAPSVEEDDDDGFGGDDDADDTPVFTIEPSPTEIDDETADADPIAPRRRRAADTAAPAGQSVARFATVAALTVVLVYGVLSIYFHTHPVE